MSATIRAKVDTELSRRIGTWVTVREIQDKLHIKQATLKPLIMKYARESLLKRRHVRGTARSVQFTPAAKNASLFKNMLLDKMPYRNLLATAQKAAGRKTAKKATKKTAKRATKKTTKRSRR